MNILITVGMGIWREWVLWRVWGRGRGRYVHPKPLEKVWDSPYPYLYSYQSM